MTKKDFKLIASTLRALPYWLKEEEQRKKETITRFADSLQDAYPNFDRGKFVVACWIG